MSNAVLLRKQKPNATNILLSKLLILNSVNTTDLERIAQHVKKVKEWPDQKQIDYFLENLKLFDRTPDEISAIRDYNFQAHLLNNRTFAEECGLPYSSMDEYWDAIRAGFTSYCLEKCSKQQFKASSTSR